VKEKTQNIEYEIIVVDNASTEIGADEFLKYHPEIILKRSQTNIGFARGNNFGLEVAKGEFILLLNSDSFIQNNVPLLLMNFLKRHTQVGAVTGQLQYPDGRVQHNCQRFPSIRFQLFELLRLQKIFPRRTTGKILFGPFFDYKSIAFPDWIWGTCFMFRKSILSTLKDGKLADDFFMYVEDMQWCMEFHKLGFKVAFVPEASVIHLLGQSQGAKHVLMEENYRKFMDMYYSPFHRKVIGFIEWLLKIRFNR
jgi:GT2 family glycosyltransferase